MNDILRRLLGLAPDRPAPAAPQLGGAVSTRPAPTTINPDRVYTTGATSDARISQAGGNVGTGAGTGAFRPNAGVPQVVEIPPDRLTAIDAANPLPPGGDPASMGSLDGTRPSQPGGLPQPTITPGQVTILPTIPISPLAAPQAPVVVEGKTLGERTPAYLQRTTGRDFFNTAKPKLPPNLPFKDVDAQKLERARLEETLRNRREGAAAGNAIEREDERLGLATTSSDRTNQPARTERASRERTGMATEEYDARLALAIRQEVERRRKENLLRVLAAMPR